MTGLSANTLEEDPFELFKKWFEEAKQSEINDSDAMALASVDGTGRPSVRMVLLKEILPEGFVFYTNYTSRKSEELLTTKKVAFVLHWKSLRRQIRVVGSVEQVSAAQSDAYFSSRSRPSRIGAWASKQSTPLSSRTELAGAVAQIEMRFSGEVPRPPNWGGFLIRPDEIEFWADGESRLHDRFQFQKDAAGNWLAERLYP